MGWWSRASDTETATTNDTSVQETQDVIASIFEPGHRSLSAEPSSSQPAKYRAEQPHQAGAHIALHSRRTDTDEAPQDAAQGRWQRWSAGLRTWVSSPSPPAESTTRDGEAQELKSPAPPSTAATVTAPPMSWDQLPPSPLAGYELGKDGLVDKLRTPPHTLTAVELKDLIRELTTVEQNAKYNVDKQFAGHLGNRGLHGLELLVNPCLFLVGIYLMTWKTVQLYNSALPQDSIVFTKILALLRRRLPVGQREQLAQRHRRLLRATNARVAMTFLSGVGVFSLAWVSRPTRTVMEDAPDMLAAREMVSYQRHTEATLKWCWYVYYHHPAYRTSQRADK